MRLQQILFNLQLFIQRSRKNASSTLPSLLNSNNKNFFKDRLFSTYELQVIIIVHTSN